MVKKVRTHTATIYLGIKNIDNNKECEKSDIYSIIQSYVDKIGLCVTITPLKYFYTNGNENGFAIGLINYPRFPEKRKDIEKKALELASILKTTAKQMRVSVVFPGKTIMLS